MAKFRVKSEYYDDGSVAIGAVEETYDYVINSHLRLHKFDAYSDVFDTAEEAEKYREAIIEESGDKISFM